jgi:crotonobetainyl-CoA:carnitine CoA-transferase CaiB-like acyl-CoA transferase
MNGAVGTMLALCQRVHTGKGQHVEGITQQGMDIICSAEIEGPYAFFGEIPKRHGRARAEVTLKDGSIFYNPLLWECKDGFIALNLLLNPSAAKNNHSMMEFIRKDGIDTGSFGAWEWENKSWEDMSREQAEELMEVLGKFFKNHTKDELLKLATENRFQLGPCNNAADALKYPQLQARGFWKDIEHPELGATLKYPGGAVMTTQGYVGVRQRAPLIGEHNEEIYKELELADPEIVELKKQKVI